MGKINKWITALVFAVISTFTVSCSEQKLELYDTSRSALYIAKGSVFGRVADYPEEYAFNAYFLGGRVTDYELSIPVRLQGVVDTIHDRRYQIAIVDSASHGLVPAVYTFNREQIFHRGMWQDSLHVTIHVAAMSDTTNYKMRIALVPNALPRILALHLHCGITIASYAALRIRRANVLYSLKLVVLQAPTGPTMAVREY